jgi:SAM-dependent methyltransferase
VIPFPRSVLRLPGYGGQLDDAVWTAIPKTPEGIPLLVRDAEGYLAQLQGEWDGPLSAFPFAAACQLARYLPFAANTEGPLQVALKEMLDLHAAGPIGLAVEAGCSIGSLLPVLSAAADHVVGFDSNVAPLRAAAWRFAGEHIPLPVREEGHVFDMSRTLPPISVDNVTLVVGNGLNPPLQSESSDLVVACNLLDSISEPCNLIGQLDAILKPGGLLVLASPFDWREDITPTHEQLGGSTSTGAMGGQGSPHVVEQLLQGNGTELVHLNYEVLETRDVPWQLQEHARCRVHYLVYMLIARKAV